jgi:acetyltransferase-like isoleucine patch superfamily enzyme
VKYIAYDVVRGIKRILEFITGIAARFYLRAAGATIGSGLKIRSFPICRKHPLATIRIGSNVGINNKITENPSGIVNRTVLVADGTGALLEIGNNVGISGAILYCCERIVIEDYVNIGAGARIYDTDFHSTNWLERRRNLRSKETKPVRICHDAWIGANAIILKGVTVGERSIVAAGAIVTSDVPPDCMVGGVPAKVIRHLSLD